MIGLVTRHAAAGIIGAALNLQAAREELGDRLAALDDLDDRHDDEQTIKHRHRSTNITITTPAAPPRSVERPASSTVDVMIGNTQPITTQRSTNTMIEATDQGTTDQETRRSIPITATNDHPTHRTPAATTLMIAIIGLMIVATTMIFTVLH